MGDASPLTFSGAGSVLISSVTFAQSAISSTTNMAATYRPVVNQRNIHHSLEDTILDFLVIVQFLNLLEESCVQLFAFIGTSGLMKIWLRSFLCRSQKGELRHCLHQSGFPRSISSCGQVLTAKHFAVDIDDIMFPFPALFLI